MLLCGNLGYGKEHLLDDYGRYHLSNPSIAFNCVSPDYLSIDRVQYNRTLVSAAQ